MADLDDSIVASVFDDGESSDNFSPVVAVVSPSNTALSRYPPACKHVSNPKTLENQGQGCTKGSSEEGRGTESRPKT
jgi:hypothetical protein